MLDSGKGDIIQLSITTTATLSELFLGLTLPLEKGTVHSFISSQTQPDPPLLEQVRFPVNSTWILWKSLLPSNLSGSKALPSNAPSQEMGRSSCVMQRNTHTLLKKKKKESIFSFSLLQQRFFFSFGLFIERSRQNQCRSWVDYFSFILETSSYCLQRIVLKNPV